jgi:hypothetical protein
MPEPADNAETGARKPPARSERADNARSEAAELEIGALEAELPPLPERTGGDTHEGAPPTTTEQGERTMKTQRRSMLLPLVMPLLLAGCAESQDPLAPVSPEGPAHLLIPAAGYVQVATGVTHTCGLKSDGTVACWGTDSHGQTVVPAGLEDVTQVTAGAFHTCALRSNGTVACWGNSPLSFLPIPGDLSDATQVDAGGNSTCAVRNGGTVVCWGSTERGKTDVPADLAAITQVSVGSPYACALRSEGTVRCWGTDDTWGVTNPPADLVDVTQVSAGDLHACALRSDGTVRCWGDNRTGAATPPVDLAEVTQLSAGSFRTCALGRDATVVCWGNPNIPAMFADVAQLGEGTESQGVCAVKLNSTIVCYLMPGPQIRVHPTATFSATPGSVVAGESFALALGDAQVPGHPEATEFTYAFDCGDGSGYGDFASSTTAICPTTVIGTRNVRGRVRDQDGDQTEYTATVEVTPFFAFSGFLPPIYEGVANQLKAGQAVPVKFSLGGDQGLQIFASGSPGSEQIACDLTDVTSTIAETAVAGSSSLAYDAQSDTYTYVWKTDKRWSASCRRLMLQLADGQMWTADFEFTR